MLYDNQPTAGLPMFELLGLELYETDGPVQHISRYLPSVRRARFCVCCVCMYVCVCVCVCVCVFVCI